MPPLPSSSKANYHPLEQLTPEELGDPSRPETTGRTDQSSMGSVRRLLKYGGWRRNVLLSTIAGTFLLIFYHHQSRFRFNPGSGDSLGTSPCASSSGAAQHRYALMVDAGSTGSRIHVYRFSSCSASGQSKTSTLPTLDHELFFKTQPGLSSYARQPVQAAESLRPLLQAALEGVPFEERRCTPISVKATAGLRLLGDRESTEILQEVERWLRKEWPFKLPEKDAVTIMDGADEGVHAWVTINYLLKMIGSPSENKPEITAAVMDLGGASTQIVFEPHGITLEPGPHIYTLSFGGKSHALYQHSHLGYGLMEARRAVHHLVAYAEMWRRKTKWSSLSQNGPIGNPCLLRNSTRQVTLVVDGTGGDSQTVNFIGTRDGFEACKRVVELVMAKDTICKISPCAFGGVYQPRLSETFPRGPIYALSYFYDRLYPLGLKSTFTLHQLLQLVKFVCRGPPPGGWKASDFNDSEEAIEELNGRPEACLDLTFIYSLLSFGYELESSRQIIISKQVNSVELGWALGATIDLIENIQGDDCNKKS